MVELWVNYFSGDFFVGTFENESDAQQYYDDNKEEFIDYRGIECGHKYGTPIFKSI